MKDRTAVQSLATRKKNSEGREKKATGTGWRGREERGISGIYDVYRRKSARSPALNEGSELGGKGRFESNKTAPPKVR